MTRTRITENSMIEDRKDGDEIEAYLRIWSETAASVLGQITGQTLSLEVRRSETAVPFAAEVFLNITLAGGLRGEQSLVFSVAHARWLAGALTGEQAGLDPPAEPTDGLKAELSADQREALEELFRQVAGRIVSALKSFWGEVQIHVQAGDAPSWPPAAMAWLETAGDARPPVALELRLSAALAAALRRSEGVPITAEAEAAADVSSSSEVPKSGEVNLDFLKNVPLDLTLRFGHRRMLLREILELGPGSVIELDRRLREPVDLLLDGQVLARGEVVVIQGCYGLRVTEIAACRGVER